MKWYEAIVKLPVIGDVVAFIVLAYFMIRFLTA